jgi:hypothetical protein
MKNLVFTLAMLMFVSGLSAQNEEFHLDKEYKISKTGTIDANFSDAKVFVTGSSRGTVHVKIDRKVTTKGLASGGTKFSVEVNESNGDLRIREKKEGSNITVAGFYNEEYKVEIEAPEGTNLVVRGDDGDYFIKNVNGSISLSLDDADAELADCKGSKFKFRSDDGDVRMNTGSGSLEITGDDADIQIYNGRFTSINATIDDGDLIIETTLDNNGAYSLSAEDGLVSMNVTGGGGEFSIHHEDGNITKDGVFKTLEESENLSRFSLSNGSAKVTVRADDARVKLSASN